jgi:hypothetical protein
MFSISFNFLHGKYFELGFLQIHCVDAAIRVRNEEDKDTIDITVCLNRFLKQRV